MVNISHVGGYKNEHLFEMMIGKTLVGIYDLVNVVDGSSPYRHHKHGNPVFVMSDGDKLYAFSFSLERDEVSNADYDRVDDYRYNTNPDTVWLYIGKEREKELNPFGRVLTSISYSESPRWTRCGYWESSVHLYFFFGDMQLSFYDGDTDYDATEDDDEFFFRYQIYLLSDEEFNKVARTDNMTYINGACL